MSKILGGRLRLIVLISVLTAAVAPASAMAAGSDTGRLSFDPWSASVSIKTYKDVRLERPDFNSTGTEIVGDLRASSISGGGIETFGGTDHIYVSSFNPRTGVPGKPRCLTCDGPGPNGFAKWSPDDSKILFSSGRLRNPGGPRAGGGAPKDDLWVMNADGSDPTQLTGIPGQANLDEYPGQTDFHAVWAPDGKSIAWVHHDCALKCHWRTMIAGYREKPSPHLVDVHPLEPDDTGFHETQDFTPDGLLMETITAEGFMNGESYLIDPDTGARVNRLTHNPFWDEQFHSSSDPRVFVQMSARANPGYLHAKQSDYYWDGIEPDDDFVNAAVLAPAFNRPDGPRTDLYLIDRRQGDQKIRRLTYFGDSGQVIPEFAWSSDGRYLAWGGKRVSGPGTADFLGLQILTFHPRRPIGGERARLARVKVRPKRRTVKAGRKTTFRVKVANSPKTAVERVKACLKTPRKLLRGKRCVKLGDLDPGEARTARFKLRPTRKAAHRRRPVKLRFRVSGKHVCARSARARVRVR